MAVRRPGSACLGGRGEGGGGEVLKGDCTKVSIIGTLTGFNGVTFFFGCMMLHDPVHFHLFVGSNGWMI